MKIDVIGVSHSSEESSNLVEEKLKETDYDRCMIELDEERLGAIQSEKTMVGMWFDSIKKTIKERKPLRTIILLIISPLILLLSIIKLIYKSITGDVAPGLEKAYDISEDENIETHLVDRTQEKTMKRMVDECGIRGTIKFIIWNYYSNIKNSIRKKEISDIEGVDSDKDIQGLESIIEDKFPDLYRVLVEERNHIMAIRTIINSEDEENIAIVVGAAHANGILELLDNHSSVEETNFIIVSEL
jgi:pheromone shutdown protein TraB